MEVKGELFKFLWLFEALFGLIWAYLILFGPIGAYSHASRQRAELEADYSSIRASVRASPSSGKLKTYDFAVYCLKFQKITYVFYST